MQADQKVSYAVLRALIPLTDLSDDQLNLLLEHAQLLNLYKGQELVSVGDSNQHHLYLLHGKLQTFKQGFTTASQTIESGDDESFLPIADEHPRQHKVVASSDCTVLQVESLFLEKLLCWGAVSRALLAEIAMDKNYFDDYLWIQKLLESKLFYKIPPTNIYSILNKFEALSVSSGENIIEEGAEGSCCYLIKSGSAEVFVEAVGAKPVAVLNAGAVFGEDALVTQSRRNATVTMVTDGELMKLEKRDFYHLLKQPEVTMVTPGNIEGFLKSGAVLLDVRTQKEFDIGHHVGALNVPLHLSYLKSVLLDQSLQYICYSASEERARASAFLLSQQGFKVFALQGGMPDLAI